MSIRGSDAAERRGMVWALSDKHDHPGGVLMKARNRVSRGSTIGISIKKEEVMQFNCYALMGQDFWNVENTTLVRAGANFHPFYSQIDRSALSAPCYQRNKTFEDKYGVRQTRMNVDLTTTHYKYNNCSYAVYAGFKQGTNRERYFLNIFSLFENPCSGWAKALSAKGYHNGW